MFALNLLSVYCLSCLLPIFNCLPAKHLSVHSALQLSSACTTCLFLSLALFSSPLLPTLYTLHSTLYIELPCSLLWHQHRHRHHHRHQKGQLIVYLSLETLLFGSDRSVLRYRAQRYSFQPTHTFSFIYRYLQVYTGTGTGSPLSLSPFHSLQSSSHPSPLPLALPSLLPYLLLSLHFLSFFLPSFCTDTTALSI